MSINANTTYLELLDDYHKNPNKFVFFIGTGLSQPLFPTWDKLLINFIEIAKDAGLQYNTDELHEYIKKGENYLDIAEICINAMGDNKYRDLMEKIFDIDLTIEIVPIAYKELFALAPKVIVTTNYDRIPDIAGAGLYRPFTNKTSTECSRAILGDKKVIYKLHGDISDQSSIVLKNTDYQNIVHSNSNTRQLLSSLMNSRVFIFIGFSLSDPHIGLVLESLKNINSNIPISHYIFINEPSAFKIASYENKYGIKIIQYTPTDNTHPEVIEFIKALSNKTEDVIQIEASSQHKVNLNTNESIRQYVFSELSKLYPDSSLSIFINNNDLFIALTPVGETKVEIQKEILSIIKLFRLECKIVNNIIVRFYANTPPSIDFDQTQLLLLELIVEFKFANQYAIKHITLSTLWSNVVFKSPASLSDIFLESQIVTFPLNTGIVDI